MLSLFEFAIGVGLLVFIVFVACVYGGMLCLYIWDTAKKFLWKLAFVTLYLIFILLVTYVIWLVFYFGLNA